MMKVLALASVAVAASATLRLRAPAAPAWYVLESIAHLVLLMEALIY
jgi:hypothetical protein